MPERLAKWYFTDLTTVAYRSAWKLQKNILEAKKENENFPDVVLFLEHTPVFTLGRKGGMENLKVSEGMIRDSGAEIIPVERGGDITYHGPGQLVGYPVIHLPRNGLKVIDYVEKLEEAMLQTVYQWGISAGRNVLNRGIWVENRKLGSIGIAVKRGISFHGFSLNVDVSLKPYEWINPCGLKDVSITSMIQETMEPISIDQVREAIRYYMSGVFNINWQSMSFPRLKNLMESA
ncbi:MAG: lipoyl(octanoyl) transferase LipB [Desulfobacterales bacterium]